MVVSSTWTSGLTRSIQPNWAGLSEDGVGLQLGIQQQLASRRKASMQEFTTALQEQEQHYMACDWQPTAGLDDLRPGTWYLDAVDAKGRRCYRCKPS